MLFYPIEFAGAAKWQEEEKSVTRNNSLDFLKGVAILLVIFTHSSFATEYRESNLFLFQFIVDMAIPVFMVISGYVNCISMNGKGIKDVYKKKVIGRKLSRIILPFIPCIILQLVAWLFIERVGIAKTLVYSIFQRWGAGGYYPIIMIQFILLFPLIFRESHSIVGVMSIVILNLVSEFVFNVGGGIQGYIGQVIVWLHRICILRYLSFILAGILLYRYEERLTFLQVMLMVFCGGSLVYVLNYKIKSEVVFGLWRETSIMVVFWASSFVALILKTNAVINYNSLPLRFISQIGRATYSIFVVQLIWYSLIEKKLFNEPSFIVSVSVCIIIGLLYNQLDKVIQKRLCQSLNRTCL